GSGRFAVSCLLPSHFSLLTFFLMPALPEVDTMVRQLATRVVGRSIIGVRLTHDDLLGGTTRATMVRGLRGRLIERVTRRAKHALVHTDTKILAAQPGMTGGLEFLDRPRSGIDAKYDVLTCTLDDGG